MSKISKPSNTASLKPKNDLTATTQQEDVWLNEVSFNSDGLLPAIAQDKQTGEILMVAWMNKDALKQTVDTKTAVYFSRSRNKLWHKGESSGHTQLVHDIHLDCDADVIVLNVTQTGGIACHTGRKSCFYRRLDLSGSTPQWQTTAPVLKDPKEIYSSNNLDNASNNKAPSSDSSNKNMTNSHAQINGQNMNALSVLNALDAVLVERKNADASSSYVASLYAKGLNKILEKVGEEAVESIIAAKDLANSAPNTNSALNNSHKAQNIALVNDLIYETADVWFHTMVTLAWFDIGSEQVLAELARRFGLSGIDEKNSRSN